MCFVSQTAFGLGHLFIIGSPSCLRTRRQSVKRLAAFRSRTAFNGPTVLAVGCRRSPAQELFRQERHAHGLDRRDTVKLPGVDVFDLFSCFSGWSRTGGRRPSCLLTWGRGAFRGIHEGLNPLIGRRWASSWPPTTATLAERPLGSKLSLERQDGTLQEVAKLGFDDKTPMRSKTCRRVQRCRCA